MAELISYRIVISGKLPAASKADAVTYIREGLSMSFPLHESIDDLVITTTGESMEDLKQRFSGEVPQQ